VPKTGTFMELATGPGLLTIQVPRVKGGEAGAEREPLTGGLSLLGPGPVERLGSLRKRTGSAQQAK